MTIRYDKKVIFGLIKAKQLAKARKRRKYSLALMLAYQGLYSCSDCIHGLSGSCTDALPNGCEYWFNAVTGEQFVLL